MAASLVPTTFVVPRQMEAFASLKLMAGIKRASQTLAREIAFIIKWNRAAPGGDNCCRKKR